MEENKQAFGKKKNLTYLQNYKLPNGHKAVNA
jgi:hypothetical protein